MRPLLEHAREKEDVKEDPEFINLMMDVYYDVFRDLPNAINRGKDFLKFHKSIPVEVKLINFYLKNDNLQAARDLLTKLKGAIDLSKWMRMESKIFEQEKRYQDAIDTMEAIPDRRNFEERYTSHLSFLELKMGEFDKAVKRCKNFLEARSFSRFFEAEIINYEYGKKMSGKHGIDKKRIDEVAENTDMQMVKGVCYSLLGKDDDALKIFRKEAEKRFSRIDDCLQWPAVSRHEKELLAIRNDLLRAKRSLTDLPKLEQITQSSCLN